MGGVCKARSCLCLQPRLQACSVSFPVTPPKSPRERTFHPTSQERRLRPRESKRLDRSHTAKEGAWSWVPGASTLTGHRVHQAASRSRAPSEQVVGEGTALPSWSPPSSLAAEQSKHAPVGPGQALRAEGTARAEAPRGRPGWRSSAVGGRGERDTGEPVGRVHASSSPTPFHCGEHTSEVCDPNLVTEGWTPSLCKGAEGHARHTGHFSGDRRGSCKEPRPWQQ